MKAKAILPLSAGLLLATTALPALADVTVTATVDKTKTVDVVEHITKFKSFFVTVVFTEDLNGAAEAMAIVNATNSDNVVDQSGQVVPFDDPFADPDSFLDDGTFINFGWQKDALIDDSINENTGIVGVNQDVGNMDNQGNKVSAAIIGDEDGSAAAFTNTQAEVDQRNTNNFVHREEIIDNLGAVIDGSEEADPDLTTTISGSINFNEGIVGVNQSSGNMNNQHNVLALAVGFGAKVALAESALGQENTDNKVNEVETVKLSSISDSINNNSGIVGVNQSTGNMNNQASVVSFSALTSTAAISVPGS